MKRHSETARQAATSTDDDRVPVESSIQVSIPAHEVWQLLATTPGRAVPKPLPRDCAPPQVPSDWTS